MFFGYQVLFVQSFVSILVNELKYFLIEAATFDKLYFGYVLWDSYSYQILLFCFLGSSV